MTSPTNDREELVTSHHAFTGGRLAVRIDTVRQPSGRETTREVVEHPPTVVVVPVTDDGDLLLIRQYRHPVAASLLSLPAGAIDSGEDAENAARRELREETGYAAERLSHLLTCSPISQAPAIRRSGRRFSGPTGAGRSRQRRSGTS